MNSKQFDKNKIINNFNNAASSYEKNATFQKRVLEELLENLSYVSLQPKVILDMGCGVGRAAPIISKHFPNAKIVQLDISQKMIFQAKKKNTFWKKNKAQSIVADMLQMPFLSGTFDLIICSLSLQWISDIESVFHETRRCLNNDGLFLFSTLGPQTMHELREAWLEIDDHEHVHNFFEIDYYGDELVRTGFSDPVISREEYKLMFGSPLEAIGSIRSIGASNVSLNRRKSLTPKSKWQSFIRAYEKQGPANKVPLTYEVYYGLAWSNNRNHVASEVTVPLSSVHIRHD